MLPWAARGQALAEWYYWFDTDDKPHEMGTVTNQQFKLQTDVSHLSRGFHTLFVQVKDTAGVYSTPYSQMFYNMPESENHLLKFCYWFDNSGDVIERAYEKGQYLLDVSHLHPGFHFLNYYLYDMKGTMTDIHSTGFYCSPMPSRQKLYYWLAGDTVATQIPDFSGDVVLDVTRAYEGFNTIFFLMEDNGLSNTQSYNFIKVPQTENAGDMTLVCIIDGKVVGEEKVSAHGGLVKCEMDVSNISTGVHKAMFQLITPTGVGSSVAETYFIRTLTNKEVASMQCSYTIDGYLNRTEKGTCTNGVFHFDLPVDEIEEGLHRIDYMLVAENGTTTTQGNAWFFKTPVGGNGIKQYDYWLNDNSDEVKSVTLDDAKDPFQLIKLLPIPSEPIRSSCFQFEVKDGEPMMYAKNDIHFRFHDKTGRWVDESKQYVDYNTSAAVTDITELKSTQTFNRPEDNSIKWFKFDAEYGDSIALKSNQATSIQIFSTSGKELYATSGSNSVNFGGCHVFEDGTFYVAVHDVTGSAQNITLESKKIEKFCIFDYSPDKITSEGNVIMTFSGNGLEYVKSVKLTGGDISIVADTLMAKSSEMMAAFHLNENIASIKKLSLEVYFNNEIKNESKALTLKDAITLEPVKAGNIEVFITRENRVGDPYPIQIHIKNTGNLAYTAIPFGLAFDNVNNFDAITFENFKLFLTEERYKERDFFTYTNNLLGQGKKGIYIPMILPYLGPYEELIYTVGIKTKIAQADINAYAWTIEPWSESVKKHMLKSSRSFALRRAKECTPSNLPQVYDALDDLNDIADALDLPTSPIDLAKRGVAIGETLGGIEQGATRMNEDAVFDAYGIDPSFLPGDLDDYRMQFRYCPRNPTDIINEFLPDWIQIHTDRGTNSMADMASGDCPRVKPEPVNPWIPGDPNEITGYLSESGTHYINHNVVNVGYDIEFENDPEIANAAAHHIVIRDTLDARFFDFDSFEPKTVKISGKEVELEGTYPFVKSLDMRPEIYSIAELRGDFDKKTGIATWDLIALDPMTMEPTDDIMQGILPVNTQEGNGIGNVTYTINLKHNLRDGTDIPNRAGIVFDYNDEILTPVWTNTIDAISPVSEVSSLEQMNDSIVRVHFDGYDNRSDIWKYSLYVQYGEGSTWNEVAEMDSAHFDFRFYEDIDYGFCVLATDSAGNVEQKIIQREYMFLNGKTEKIDAIIAPVDKKRVAVTKAYDLSGRVVQEEGYRGIIIKNRKKVQKR